MKLMCFHFIFRRRLQAEKDFQQIVMLVGSTSSTTESTKMMTNESCALTPPVTPESVNDKMTEDQFQLPQPTKAVGVKHNGFAKHTNAIQHQHISKAIDFDDDIFELDGMQDDAQKENNHYNKYSDTEEGSDGEPAAIERRVYNRNRSGSVNIARSAPISMPQFNHHVIHTIDADDEKAVNEQQMDIASSIKMIARSVHIDSIFGELPNRPVLRFNNDF